MLLNIGELAEQVDKGLAHLDRMFPDQEWVEMIDLKNLDLHDTSKCVLGQLYGGYDDGLDVMFDEDTAADPADCGFDVRDRANEGGSIYVDGTTDVWPSSMSFVILTLMWRRAIMGRLSRRYTNLVAAKRTANDDERERINGRLDAIRQRMEEVEAHFDNEEAIAAGVFG